MSVRCGERNLLFGQKNLAINKLMIISHTPSLQQKLTYLTFILRNNAHCSNASIQKYLKKNQGYGVALKYSKNVDLRNLDIYLQNVWS